MKTFHKSDELKKNKKKGGPQIGYNETKIWKGNYCVWIFIVFRIYTTS
jgi:hypothetical protein